MSLASEHRRGHGTLYDGLNNGRPVTAPTNGALATHIRQVIAKAHQNGLPTPGTTTLVRLTGATDHAIRPRPG